MINHIVRVTASRECANVLFIKTFLDVNFISVRKFIFPEGSPLDYRNENSYYGVHTIVFFPWDISVN